MDLEELVAGHQTSLYAFLYRMTGDAYLAEDLMQETFVRALQASKTYKPQGRLSSWLFSIAANLTKDHWRKQRNRRSVPLGIGRNQASERSTEDKVLAHSEAENLRSALLELPLGHRAPLVLFYYHDLGYEDIARCLAIPVGTVRSRIHNGKTRIKRILEGGVPKDD